LTDADVLKAAQLRLTPTGARIMRNFVGGAWVGRKVKSSPKTVTLSGARFVEAGLGTGSSDGIGWTPVTVTPDMVGEQEAVFTAVECKTLGYDTLTEEQVNFLEQVAQAGGVAIVARELPGGQIALDNVAKRG